MKLSTKGRYGMRTMVDLALQYSKGPVRASSICAREEISPAYLEQILTTLRNAGLVRSSAGPRGGFTLTRNPSCIKTLEVFQAMEGQSTLVECINSPAACSRSSSCLSRHLWCSMKQAMERVLINTSLQDLLDNKFEQDTIEPK